MQIMNTCNLIQIRISLKHKAALFASSPHAIATVPNPSAFSIKLQSLPSRSFHSMSQSFALSASTTRNSCFHHSRRFNTQPALHLSQFRHLLSLRSQSQATCSSFFSTRAYPSANYYSSNSSCFSSSSLFWNSLASNIKNKHQTYDYNSLPMLILIGLSLGSIVVLVNESLHLFSSDSMDPKHSSTASTNACTSTSSAASHLQQLSSHSQTPSQSPAQRQYWYNMQIAGYSLSTGITVIIALNTLVFLGWQSVYFNAFLQQHFVHYASDLKRNRSYTLLTSAFSHTQLFHFLFNMIAFTTIASSLLRVIDEGPLISMYLISCVTSSALSPYLTRLFLMGKPKLLHHEMSRGSIGASGGVLALFALSALIAPNSIYRLMFIPVDIPAYVLFPVVVGLDVAGLLYFRFTGKSSLLGHGAHLAGAFTGVVFFFVYGKQARDKKLKQLYLDHLARARIRPS